MRQSLVPVFLLAAVALSSSNILPLLTTNQIRTEPLGLDSQNHDNTFRNLYQTKNTLNHMFYKLSDNRQNDFRKFDLNYVQSDNNQDENNLNVIDKNDEYNGDEVPADQWHRYPRQLDNLHKYLHEHYYTDQRNLDPDGPGNEDSTKSDIRYKYNDLFNEYHTGSSSNDYDNLDTSLAATNPFLILRIQLSHLSDDIVNGNINPNSLSDELDPINPELQGDQEFTNFINPSLNTVNVKRNYVHIVPDGEWAENPAAEKNTRVKRIFSLLSRLKGFNPKGHELHHRRHQQFFFGLQDGSGKPVLTAETRASLLRAPGSPLRWG